MHTKQPRQFKVMRKYYMGILYRKAVLYGNNIRWKDLQDLLSEKSKLLITVHSMLPLAGENRQK